MNAHPSCLLFSFYFYIAVLGAEPRTLPMLYVCSTSLLHWPPLPTTTQAFQYQLLFPLMRHEVLVEKELISLNAHNLLIWLGGLGNVMFNFQPDSLEPSGKGVLTRDCFHWVGLWAWLWGTVVPMRTDVGRLSLQWAAWLSRQGFPTCERVKSSRASKS